MVPSDVVVSTLLVFVSNGIVVAVGDNDVVVEVGMNVVDVFVIVIDVVGYLINKYVC